MKQKTKASEAPVCFEWTSTVLFCAVLVPRYTGENLEQLNDNDNDTMYTLRFFSYMYTYRFLSLLKLAKLPFLSRVKAAA